MYLLKDIRSFKYKLVPVIQDGKIIAKLQEHKVNKSKKIRELHTFETKHLRQYNGLEQKLVQNPNFLSTLPDEQNLLRLFAKKIRRAISILYARKNSLTDARYYIRKRSNYIIQVKKPLVTQKKTAILN